MKLVKFIGDTQQGKNKTMPSVALITTLLLFLFASTAQAALPTEDLFHSKSTFDADTHPGKALYKTHCASCHEGNLPKAPHREILATLPVTTLLDALTNGIMRQQSKMLNQQQKQQIAEYLARTDLASYQAQPKPAMCQGNASQFDRAKPPAQVGWGYDPIRFVPAAVAGLNKTDIHRLKLKWAFAFPGAMRARSQPVVAMGAIYVGSQDGTVYALDLETGCVRWSSTVGAEVRTAIVVEPWPQGTIQEHNPRLFFGDLLGRVYAMDALTGDVLWKITADQHANTTITGTPLLYDNTLYAPVSSLETSASANPDYPCCTFRGSVIALDIDTGAIKWRHYSIEQAAVAQGNNSRGIPEFGPAGGGVWTGPSFDPRRNLIYHGSGQSYSAPSEGNSDAVFAVNAQSGERVWHQQMTAGDIWGPLCIMIADSCQSDIKLDSDIGASVLLLNDKHGNEVLVAGQKSGWVYGLDPKNQGRLLWRQRMGRGSLFGGVHFGMAAEGMRLYVPIADTQAQWDGKPPLEQGFPGLHAIDAVTGKILWRTTMPDMACETCEYGISSAITAIPDVVFAGHLDGMLRAYDGKTGKILWQTDTTKAVKTQNGTLAKGGSMSGPGPAIAEGHVIVNSGYGFATHQPGNALFVYSINGK